MRPPASHLGFICGSGYFIVPIPCPYDRNTRLCPYDRNTRRLDTAPIFELTVQLGNRSNPTHRHIADTDLGRRGRRQVQIHARTKPDETIALPAREGIALVCITQYATCNQSGYLDAGNVDAILRTQMQC